MTATSSSGVLDRDCHADQVCQGWTTTSSATETRDLSRGRKLDQEALGHLVPVAHGSRADTDPIAALDAWHRHRGSQPGPLFTGMRNRHVSTEPLSGTAVGRMLRTRAQAAGLPAERITPHSLRAGHATTAAIAGVSLDRIATQTRHKRLSTLLERYIRPAQALDFTSSRDLGL